MIFVPDFVPDLGKLDSHDLNMFIDIVEDQRGPDDDLVVYLRQLAGFAFGYRIVNEIRYILRRCDIFWGDCGYSNPRRGYANIYLKMHDDARLLIQPAINEFLDGNDEKLAMTLALCSVSVSRILRSDSTVRICLEDIPCTSP